MNHHLSGHKPFNQYSEIDADGENLVARLLTGFYLRTGQQQANQELLTPRGVAIVKDVVQGMFLHPSKNSDELNGMRII